MTDKEKLDFIISKYPVDTQIGIAQEECAELIQAISKLRRYGPTDKVLDNLAEEMADVHICLYQLQQYIGNSREIEYWVHKKAERSIERYYKNGAEVHEDHH